MLVSLWLLYLGLSLWEMRGDKGGDAHFTDENSEAPRGAGAQLGLFTGPDRTFFSLVCLSLARHILP